jgi:hypothetical protein
MGAPRQESFLLRHRDHLGASVGLGVGGSFDVWAGVVKRAPVWTQRAKVEWLYRLATDPRRMRRQTALPRFAMQVLRWSPLDYGPPRRGGTSGTRIGDSVTGHTAPSVTPSVTPGFDRRVGETAENRMSNDGMPDDRGSAG